MPESEATGSRLSRRVRIGIIVGFFILLAMAVLVGFAKGVAAFTFAAIGIAASGAVVLPLIVRRTYDIFEPLTFVLLAVVVGVTLKTFYIFFADAPTLRYLLLGQRPAALVEAGMLIVIGLVAFSVGYLTKIRIPGSLGERLWMRSPSWNSRRLAGVIMICTAIAAIAFITYLERLGIHIQNLADLSAKRFLIIEGADVSRTPLGYHRWASTLVQPAFFLAVAWMCRRRKRIWSLAGAFVFGLGALAIALPFITSSRGDVVTVLLAAAIIVYYLTPRLKVRKLVLPVIIAVGSFVAMTALRGGADDIADIAGGIGIESVAEMSVGSRHFLDLSKTAHIISAVPDEIDYKFGSTFVNWIFAPIPRAIWPEKPAVRVGALIGSEVFGLPRAGVPPGIIAELYMNFGYVGIPIGMLLLGVTLRAVYRMFEPYRDNPNAVVVYAAAIVPLSYGLVSGDFSGQVVTIVRALLPILIAVRFITRRTSVASTTSTPAHVSQANA